MVLKGRPQRINFACAAVALGFLLAIQPSHAENEVALYDSGGAATAYIATDDDMTIYLWDGKPVAYLKSDKDAGYNVYGFNGKHLGWFVNGIIWNHAGDASCAIQEALATPAQLEPLKGLKELKPLKSLQALAPLRPLFSNSFGKLPCQFLLGEGSE